MSYESVTYVLNLLCYLCSEPAPEGERGGAQSLWLPYPAFQLPMDNPNAILPPLIRVADASGGGPTIHHSKFTIHHFKSSPF